VRTSPFLSIVAGAAIALAGCAHVPQDTGRVAQPDFARAQHAATIHLAREGWPEARWWTGFHDEQLDALVTRALRDSPTLPVAAARLASARALLALERTSGGASAGVEIGANRQRYSGNGLFPQPIGGSFYNDASVQLKAGYDFDWWGKHRALVAAALGETNARQAEYSEAERTIATAVAQSYFRLQLLWARQDNASAMAALQKDILADKAARIAHGLANIDEQRNAERDLGTLNEQAAAFATRAGRETEALRVLLGGGELPRLARHPVDAGVAGLPGQLGLDLLARRPDLQAARWRVEAMLGRVAASQAAYYPDINLVGSFGLDAVSLGRLLLPDSRTMMIGSILQLPLFDSSRLDAQLGVARAERNEAVADYNQAVLHAVGEVAAEGATLQGLEQEAAAHAATQQASAALAASATRRLDRGLADRAAVLQARQALLRQEEIGLQLRDASLQSELALIKALGGGYSAPAIQTAAAKTSTQQH
jgi:multidrug efflux system outer membrane protein